MIPPVLRRVALLGFSVFSEVRAGVGSPNLVVERNPDLRAGTENDLIHLVQRTVNGWRDLAWPCSADPGRHGLTSPRRHAGGTLILAIGQNRASHAPGLHKGRPALVQVGKVAYVRDDNGDDMLNIAGPVMVGAGMGANVHDDAGVGAEASEGCVVLPVAAMRELLRELEGAAIFGPTVSLTIIPGT